MKKPLRVPLAFIPFHSICAIAFCAIGLANSPAASAAERAKAKANAVVPASAPSTFPIVPNSTGLEFIDTSFENASPVWYEQATDGTILVHLLYDHERASPNRAAGHVHFLLHARPGAKLTIELRNLDNVWNGIRGWVGREIKTMCLSDWIAGLKEYPQGKHWVNYGESLATVLHEYLGTVKP